MKRTYYLCEDLSAGYEEGAAGTSARRPASEEEANLICSLIEDSDIIHLPVLDVDLVDFQTARAAVLASKPDLAEYRWEAIASATPGHFHLFVDAPMVWTEYGSLLLDLEAAGVLEAGYVRASFSRKATFVRKPGVLKAVPA